MDAGRCPILTSTHVLSPHKTGRKAVMGNLAIMLAMSTKLNEKEKTKTIPQEERGTCFLKIREREKPQEERRK
jgi:hypothetical protein